MLVTKPTRLGPARSSSESKRVVSARQPDHVWHVDLTTVPTSLGFWMSWSPFALPQRWPFCWWVGAAVDHFSRRVMGLAVFATPPKARQVSAFLERAAARATGWPAHLITDHGKQFTARAFRKWCTRRGIRQRFGAIGKYGSIAVVERFIRSLKDECTWSTVVPLRRDALLRDLDAYARWFNADRPHERLHGATPDEIYYRRRQASRLPRFEPRARWPRSSPCARPQALVRGRPGVDIELVVTHRDGRKHLPIVALRTAA